ncbi:hypothetical protein AKO1_014922 [Acrasis kona]|uniref:Enhancer of polycomb-like N-terminal domain-containing protein n=1 Tax=Acrasis kona TaxID=1008807 RepID=A0AAW2Z1S7_9EUKA
MSRNSPTIYPQKNTCNTLLLPPTQLIDTISPDGEKEVGASTSTSPSINKKKRGRPRKYPAKDDENGRELKKPKKDLQIKTDIQNEPATPSTPSAKTSRRKDNTENADKKGSLIPARRRKLPEDKRLLLIRPQDFDSLEHLQDCVNNNFENVVGKPPSLSLKDYDDLMNNKQDEDQSEDNTDNSMHVQEPAPQVLEIPIPKFQGLEGVRTITPTHEEKHFQLPETYISEESWTTSCKQNYNVANEYDMQSDDEDWLTTYNEHARLPLSDTKFESIIALINREYGFKNGYVSVSGLMDLASLCNIQIDTSDVMAVRDWWRNKQSKVVDQMKSKEQKILSHLESYETMIKLRNDFEKLRLLMEMVRKREKLKLKYYQLYVQELKILLKDDHDKDDVENVQNDDIFDQSYTYKERADQPVEMTMNDTVEKKPEEPTQESHQKVSQEESVPIESDRNVSQEESDPKESQQETRCIEQQLVKNNPVDEQVKPDTQFPLLKIGQPETEHSTKNSDANSEVKELTTPCTPNDDSLTEQDAELLRRRRLRKIEREKNLRERERLICSSYSKDYESDDLTKDK